MIAPWKPLCGLAFFVLAGLAVPVSGCSLLCSQERQVVETEFGSIFYDLQRARLDTYRRQGFDCRSDGSIRDAFGRSIGTRYVCTKCD